MVGSAPGFISNFGPLSICAARVRAGGGGVSRCNTHGVYEPDECLSLPRPTKGWRGCNLADIKLGHLGDYWIWATSFQMYTGDCHGSSSPLMDLPHGRRGVSCRAPTREAAIDAAASHLRDRLTPRADRCVDARAVLAWLATLNPAQLNLFGEAA